MPIYEYRCDSCGHELESIQKISDAPLTECPSCGQSALRKLVSAAGFRLKGGGWYETDFKTSGQKNVIKADQEAKSKASKEAKAEDTKSAKSKPAAETSSGATKKVAAGE